MKNGGSFSGRVGMTEPSFKPPLINAPYSPLSSRDKDTVRNLSVHLLHTYLFFHAFFFWSSGTISDSQSCSMCVDLFGSLKLPCKTNSHLQIFGVWIRKTYFTGYFFSYLISAKSFENLQKSNHNQPRLKLPGENNISAHIFRLQAYLVTLGIAEAATSISHLVSEFYQNPRHRDVHHAFMSLIFNLFVPLITIILYNTVQ